MLCMIKSYRDRWVAQILLGKVPKGLPSDIISRAQNKIFALHYAETLDDLNAFPANRLEKLKGDREGQHSIRINRQWRLCFR